MAKMDAKCGPLKSGDFGDIGKNGKFGWRKWRKIARGLAIQIGCQKKPLGEWRFLRKWLNWQKLRIWNTLPLESGDFDESGKICQKLRLAIQIGWKMWPLGK